MIEQLVTRFEAARLDRRQRQLRRQEEVAIARLGEKTLVNGSELKGRLASLASEAAALRGRLQAMGRGTSQPAPSQRIEALEQKLQQIHLTAGRLVLSMPPTGAESEVLAIRAEIADAGSERDRLRGEGRRMVDETWIQVRDWVYPRGPALGTMLVAWLIARGYAASHTSTILSWVGLSHTRRGRHLMSLTADTALVRHLLPIVTAALCAYAAHRITLRVRDAREAVRARAAAARLATGSDVPHPERVAPRR